MTELVKYSGSLESDDVEKSSVEPDKDRSTDLKENSENSTEQTSPAESDKFSFPWWIVAVIAAVVIGGGILAIVLIRKGSDKVKRSTENCRIVLFVDDESNKNLTEEVQQAKREGLIDAFLFDSVSENYFASVIDSV